MRPVAVVWVLLVACAVHGQEVVTNTIRYEAEWSTNVLPVSFGVSLPKLNTNASYFGTLLSIEFGMFATNSLDAAIENDSAAPALFTLKAYGLVTITNPGPSILTYSYAGVTLAQTNLAATTQPENGRPDYAFFDDRIVTGSASGLVNSDYHSLYLGAGAFELSGYSEADYVSSGASPSSQSTSDPRAYGVAYVIYTYTLVPEPGALLPVGFVGLVSMWWLRRRRLNQSRVARILRRALQIRVG